MMTDYKIDLTRFVIREEDLIKEDIDIMGSAVEAAVKKLTELNDKTIEQHLIMKQQAVIKRLQQEISTLRDDAERNKKAPGQ